MFNEKKRRKHIEGMHGTTFRTIAVSIFKIRIKCVKFVNNAKSHMFLSFMHISLSLSWCNNGWIKSLTRNNYIARQKMRIYFLF